nr:MAG TPA: hypothetical protein [Caudoviricetes sp.]
MKSRIIGQRHNTIPHTDILSHTMELLFQVDLLVIRFKLEIVDV